MPVKIIEKQKAKAKTKATSTTESEIVHTVESMAALKLQIDAAKELTSLYEKHRDFLKKHIPPAAPADAPVKFMGTSHMVEFSAAAEVRSLPDLRALHARMGDLFYEVIALKFTELDKYVSEHELDGLMYKSRTGARQCKVKEVGP